MKIRYLGPRTEINVEPYGLHQMNEEKDYPDEFGEELLATSNKQQFEKTGESKKTKKEDSGDGNKNK